MKPVIKYLFIFICVFALLFINQYYYEYFNLVKFSHTSNLYENESSVMENMIQVTPTNLILLWTNYFSHKWDQIIKLSCPLENCQITSNRNLIPLSRAVVFHLRNIDYYDLPNKHFAAQYWVLANSEAPSSYDRKQFRVIESDINWTLTYREDSDIFAPYGRIVRRMSGEANVTRKMNAHFMNKTKEIAWIVSHCNTSSHREDYVRELQNYINVDIYGQCGPLKCEPYRGKTCYQMVERDYKFYLSFENSFCKDYVTEKLFTVLQYDVIPIVLGAANYSHLMPYNSYIDVLNFTSPKELAEYMKEVASDENKYNSYFEWKKEYKSVDTNWDYFCDLCQKLNQTPFNAKSVKSGLLSWWYQQAHCRSPNIKV